MGSRVHASRPPRRTAGLAPVWFAEALLAALLSPGLVAAAPPPATAPCQASIPDVYQRVSPAVVSINAMSINPYQPGDRIERQVGSGLIVDPSGLVLTNSHVVFGQQVITVTLDDGVSLSAQIVGADPLYDLAVIRIPAPSSGTLPTAELGESGRLLVGEEVYAIGNPLGLDQTLTRGVVSAVNRILPDVSWSLREPMIQTDAAINQGSSGGPLVDSCGKVVGINTAMMREAQSIGFAIPVDLVKSVLPELVRSGRVIRPWLGVQGQLVPAALKNLLRIPLADGFLVEVVEPGSPAGRLGVLGGDLDVTVGNLAILLGGDVITRIDGVPLDNAERLGRALSSLEVGKAVHLTLVRDSTSREVDVVLAERPFMPSDVSAARAAAPARQGRERPPSGDGPARKAF